MIRVTLAMLSISLVSHHAIAEVSAAISLSGNTVNEGDQGTLNYSYTISVDNQNYRFVDNDGSDGTFVRPDGSNESIFLTNTARVEMQSGSTNFTANDEGTFSFGASLSGSADLQTISGGFLGSFGFSASRSASITILNVAPEFDQELPDLVIPFGFNVPVTTSASDPGQSDVLTFRWDAFVDGTVDFESSEANRVSQTAVFLPPSGVLDVLITVDDGDGGSDTQQFRVTGLPGDYNQDNMVDAADYTIWRDQLNAIGSDLTADGDRNGVVDDEDYNIWEAAYGDAFVVGTETIPEPSTFLVALIATVASLGRHRVPRNAE